MRNCASAYAAICGRCVMHSTCEAAPSRRSLRPTTSATRPPMPASTSSKMRPGGASPGTRTAESGAAVPLVNSSVLIASMMRESSPPDTIRARGRSPSPTLAERKNSARSKPRGVQPDSGAGSENRTSRRAPSMASSDKACSISSQNRVAASRRAFESNPAAISYSRRAWEHATRASARRWSVSASPDRSADSAARRAMTSSNVGPCLRLRRSRSARRSSTC